MVKQQILLIFFWLNLYAITKTACNSWKCRASYKPKHTHLTDVGQAHDFFFFFKGRIQNIYEVACLITNDKKEE